jgi:hypothetical protein
MKKLGWFVKCQTCGKPRYVTPALIKKNRGKFCSRSCASKKVVYLMLKVRGESWKRNVINALIRRYKDETKHPRWLGDKVGYWGVHDWLTKHYGQPKECEVCGLKDKNKKYHWANLTWKHLRIRSDWKRMCVSCHRLYDYHHPKHN